MFMLPQTSMSICFSGGAGGGVCGKVVGIVHVITTGAGVITIMLQYFILM
jgi:hypothetical protein